MTASPTPPLVSCIMPTRDRRRFVPGAVACFLRQSYANRELVVLDDGDDSIADLLPDAHGIRYVRLREVVPIGEKRNIACEHARGSILAHWDDDDWYPAWRLARQIEALSEPGAALTGSRTAFFYEAVTARAWQYEYGGPEPFLVGSTLAYARSFWESNRFAQKKVAEEIPFIESARPEQIRDLAEPAICIASIHGANTSRRRMVGTYWREMTVEALRARIVAVASQPESDTNGAWERVV